MSEPWHCGVCGNKPCGCGDPLLLVVRVPWTTVEEDDAEMLARSLVAMVNQVRQDNSSGEADPVRLMHASWAEADRAVETVAGQPCCGDDR